MNRIVLTVVFASVAVLTLAIAQSQKSAPPLVAFFERVESTQLGATGSLNVKNTSGKDIVAFALRITFDSVDSKDQCAMEKLMILDLYPGGRERLLTGDAFSMSSNLPVKQGKLPGSPKIDVDYVQYTDGTVWGPDSLHLSRKIEGIREGKNLEKGRLRRLYQKEGVSAVTKELQPESISSRPQSFEK
ncbi:MAG: hypothetical protein JNM66_14630 [Bryobacterales bacterium]|nr:hypothetical protein [Bryobacterales bacterium]